MSNSHVDLLDREGGRGAAAKRRKAKRGGSGRNEASVPVSDADPTAKGSRPSDATAAGADDEVQVADDGRGERTARPRKAGNGRRPSGNSGAVRRERSRGGAKADESSGAGRQAEAADQATTSPVPEATSTETPT